MFNISILTSKLNLIKLYILKNHSLPATTMFRRTLVAGTLMARAGALLVRAGAFMFIVLSLFAAAFVGVVPRTVPPALAFAVEVFETYSALLFVLLGCFTLEIGPIFAGFFVFLC